MTARRPAAAFGVSIRVVANQTGIGADTLRVWERRYGFPKPARREGGSRLYAAEDVERLKLIARALREGFRPGEIVALPVDELQARLGAAEEPAVLPSGPSIDAALDALRADDIVTLRGQLRAAALALRPRAFVTDFAYPFAVRVGALWEAGDLEIRHEHLASACLETQLRLLLGAYEEGSSRPVVVLTTLPDEPHILGLEMVAVMLASSQASPRMLGRSMPVAQIVRAAEAFHADVVGLTVSRVVDLDRARAEVTELRKRLPRDCEMWIGGAGASAVLPRTTARARVTASFAELDAALADWHRSQPSR